MKRSLTPLPQLAKRLNPHLRGQLAEKAALLYYLLHGYRPLIGLSRALAQTDLTLTCGQTILLVEVKYRSSRNRGHLAVTPAQQGRLTRQMRALAGRFPSHTLRLEVFLVFPHWPFLQRIQQPYIR